MAPPFFMPPHVPQEMSLAYGFCVPKVCSREEVQPLVGAWLQQNKQDIVVNGMSKALRDLKTELQTAQEEYRHKTSPSSDRPRALSNDFEGF